MIGLGVLCVNVVGGCVKSFILIGKLRVCCIVLWVLSISWPSKKFLDKIQEEQDFASRLSYLGQHDLGSLGKILGKNLVQKLFAGRESLGSCRLVANYKNNAHK